MNDIKFAKRPGQRVLELGCGDNPHPQSDVKIDIRQTSCTDFVCSFENPLPIKDSDFDGVYAAYCLEHVSYPKVLALLKEICRVMKPGGRCVFLIPNTEEQLYWIQKHPEGWDGKDLFNAASELIFGSQDYPENSHRTFFSPVIATRLFLEAGFKDVTTVAHNPRGTDLLVQAVKPSDAIGALEQGNQLTENLIEGPKRVMERMQCGAIGPDGVKCQLEINHHGKHKAEV